MDNEEALMDATYEFFKHGHVVGSNNMKVAQMTELVSELVGHIAHSFKELVPTTITEHFGRTLRGELNSSIGNTVAVKIYSIGDEAWSDSDSIQTWFVDQNNTWYWVRHDANGNSSDAAIVSALHLVQHAANLKHPEIVYAGFLGDIKRSLSKTFSESINVLEGQQARLKKARDAIKQDKPVRFISSSK